MKRSELLVIDTSEVRPGKIEQLRSAIADLVRFVDENEPETISYQVFLDDSSQQMTVVQIHRDSASMEFHMEIAAPAFTRFKDLIELRSMEVYGSPSAKLLEQLTRKAHLLGEAELVLHPLEAGFIRMRAEPFE